MAFMAWLLHIALWGTPHVANGDRPGNRVQALEDAATEGQTAQALGLHSSQDEEGGLDSDNAGYEIRVIDHLNLSNLSDRRVADFDSLLQKDDVSHELSANGQLHTIQAHNKSVQNHEDGAGEDPICKTRGPPEKIRPGRRNLGWCGPERGNGENQNDWTDGCCWAQAKFYVSEKDALRKTFFLRDFGKGYGLEIHYLGDFQAGEPPRHYAQWDFKPMVFGGVDFYGALEWIKSVDLRIKGIEGQFKKGPWSVSWTRTTTPLLATFKKMTNSIGFTGVKKNTDKMR